MKRILSRADIFLFIVIVAVAAVGIVLMAGRGSGGTAVIRVDGNVYQEVDLATDQEIHIGAVCIEVKDGAIAFVGIRLRDTHACIKAGWLSVPGASAACLPNRISITVLGESGVDAVAQ